MKTKEYLEKLKSAIKRFFILYLSFALIIGSIICIIYGLYHILAAIMLEQSIYYVFKNTIIPTFVGLLIFIIAEFLNKLHKRLCDEKI